MHIWQVCDVNALVLMRCGPLDAAAQISSLVLLAIFTAPSLLYCALPVVAMRRPSASPRWFGRVCVASSESTEVLHLPPAAATTTLLGVTTPPNRVIHSALSKLVNCGVSSRLTVRLYQFTKNIWHTAIYRQGRRGGGGGYVGQGQDLIIPIKIWFSFISNK